MSQANMIRPDSIDRLPFLPEDKKQYYKNGLANLWRMYEGNPPGSTARSDAETKIRNASNKLMSEYAHASKGGQGARPQSGGGPPQQRPPTQGSMSAQQGGVPQPPGNVQQQPSGQPQLSQQAQNDLRGVTIHPPPTLPREHIPKYKQSWFQQASNTLRTRDAWIAKGKQAQQHVNSLQAQGQEIPQSIRQALEDAKRGVNEVNQKWAMLKQDNETKRQQGVAAAQQAGQGQTVQQQSTVNGTQAQDMQRSNTYHGSSGGQVDVKVESRTSLSPQQPQGTFQQQQQQPAPAQNASNLGQRQPPQQQPQKTPQTATQPQPAQNYPQQPPQQQYANQQRPPMNTQMSQPNMQHQTTPAQAMPNTAQQPQQPQRPQALTQQAAFSQAAESYSRQQQLPNQSQSNAPQVPHGLPFNNPASATNQPTPTSAAYPHQQMHASLSGTQTPNHKFPIPKTLHLDPRLGQQAVPAPASRPTMANAGVLTQPGLGRPPTYTLEGEGDHVLSKRKLDELVRQVTGTTTTSTSSTGGFLAPEVEASVLALADDFVDDVITSACQLAKLRPSQMLEFRDVQIVLERNYGIRIPGYGVEEVRAVRKFQPSGGWQSKMQAVQTAKTLGGVGGKGDS